MQEALYKVNTLYLCRRVVGPPETLARTRNKKEGMRHIGVSSARSGFERVRTQPLAMMMATGHDDG